ncbi:MAG: hypothetical protein Q4E05_07495 [Pseudoclavibacter sp.]|nr:hypothetical protein [Pseudoclavibacter sp.]
MGSEEPPGAERTSPGAEAPGAGASAEGLVRRRVTAALLLLAGVVDATLFLLRLAPNAMPPTLLVAAAAGLCIGFAPVVLLGERLGGHGARGGLARLGTGAAFAVSVVASLCLVAALSGRPVILM